ncbi:hypothetical protein EJ02DRAFT_455632 [Clathrospora elynae]|uniref:Uncharacterized protein n=1 Tax=Clathrospora elynae TaxID=706981 RepID=A0A6A5SMV0_9PLEO|nr:hypothetical protein EJ02DRAFT_455632 [Clathrospora elynae]
MRSLRIPLALSLASIVCASEISEALDCRNTSERKGSLAACAQPIHDVVAVVPGSSYVAKIECKDCPYFAPADEPGYGHNIQRSDQIFFLNITLSHDNRTVLLNDEPLFPLPTIPTPPTFGVTQFSTNFSNADLTSGLTCSDPYCRGPAQRKNDCVDWCMRLPLSLSPVSPLDYLYISKPSAYEGDDNDDIDDEAEYWEVAVDIIGKSNGYVDFLVPYWKFDGAGQQMLWLLVKGTPAKTQKHKGGRDTVPASDLFSPFGGNDKIYKYRIIDMRLEARAYTFPARKPLTLWRQIGYFFGTDVWEVEGRRFLYLSSEWGDYGKKGTLRHFFGEFVNWDFWYLFWIISGSTIAGLIVLFAIYKLFFWIVQQRELMKWDGMDGVWENMRRERVAEEEGALLDGGGGRYRDDPGEGGSSGPPPYTDEPLTMKPLPSKPLPEKPLPVVPLIDA